mmetsp:Transcript_46463/g.108420  ORF Transcript_46463/g.108420 Transcript_46463/m.108420 type:complete len:145 (-) Transcript_46463:100-534(-)
MDGLGEAAFTGIGRVTGARAGAVVTQTVYVDNWRAKYLRALELRTQSGEKLSGYQQYHAQALKHPLIIAGVRAKAIASTLVYVPLLDAVQQVERSGCASSLAAEVCRTPTTGSCRPAPRRACSRSSAAAASSSSTPCSTSCCST